MDFAAQLIQWYRQNKRDLPWRNTRNAYHIWLSEIILQQTRVAQGMPYYHSFVTRFPDVMDLAAADEDSVLKLWQGLGYYSRARNLHFAAKEIVQKHKGKFPQNYEAIRALKGIGDYTAAAIASFAFNAPHAVVDGNVYRVLARVFGIASPIDSPQGKKEFATLAQALILKKNPAEYNQAIMEFGALQCLPNNPDCGTCCLLELCQAARNKQVGILPLKAKKTKQRTRYFNYLLLEQGAYTYIKQRGAGDIWQGLFEFPLLETTSDISEKELLQSPEWKAFFGNTPIQIVSISPYCKHLLSHQILQARFFTIRIGKGIPVGIHNSFLKIKKQQLNSYALPRLIDRVVNDLS
ncbi:MAG: A/G-specific adenine glycosylase [Bacteroidetes bacterium]|nr:A/G-specific adenine glycosylase [Bacteroidota bacterium]